MNIKEINIKNFRNYENLYLKLNENMNIFFGKNASGKTNILEAVSMLISGKSFRTHKDKNMVNFDKDYFEIDAIIEKEGLEKDYHLLYEKNRKKKIQINLSNVNTLKELRRDSPLVVFMPEDLSIIKEGPSQRRKFLDRAISNLDLIYKFNLDKYNKILREKNNLLKYRNPRLDERLLFEAYNIQLASLGAYIVFARKNFIDIVNKYIKDIHLSISKDEEILSLEYDSEIENLDDLKIIEKEMLSKMNKALKKDLKVKYSTFGPQREDFKILINDKDLKSYGSQGQQRSAILSLKIIEVKLIIKRREIKPILLLDDVFSELDPLRRKALIDNLSGIQSFITMAEDRYLEEFSDREKNIFFVFENRVKRINGGKNAR